MKSEFKMTDELLDKWIEALESGKYRQTTGRLYNQHSGSFCCLGLLCELTEAGEWNEYEYNMSDFHIPVVSLPQLIEWNVNLEYSREHLINSRFEAVLAKLNDSGKSFKEIAQYIREHRDYIVYK